MIGTPAKTSVSKGDTKGRELGVKPDKREALPLYFKSALIAPIDKIKGN